MYLCNPLALFVQALLCVLVFPTAGTPVVQNISDLNPRLPELTPANPSKILSSPLAKLIPVDGTEKSLAFFAFQHDIGYAGRWGFILSDISDVHPSFFITTDSPLTFQLNTLDVIIANFDLKHHLVPLGKMSDIGRLRNVLVEGIRLAHTRWSGQMNTKGWDEAWVIAVIELWKKANVVKLK
ncbi:MAG: hypothetical protein M1829_002361 [Trizodia sp. TS-e1964]|nr:MAG: hypothetical protein M1829_002361 [Trizodia sp. TS-e1964]